MRTSIYGVHPGIAMVQRAIADLPARTGRSLEEWIALIKKQGPRDEASRRQWLQKTHELGTNYAGWLAKAADGRGETGDPDAYLETAERCVEAMFAGAKAPMRPIYDALLTRALSIGPDVKACPGKTIVPLYRAHVFAQIKPSTRTRIDLGLALKNTRTPARLINTGGLKKGDRITHRIEVTSLADIDADLVHWLERAHDMDR
jgi:hypothetical protein